MFCLFCFGSGVIGTFAKSYTSQNFKYLDKNKYKQNSNTFLSLDRSFNIFFLVDIMEVEASFLAQQPQNFASIFLETCFPMLLLFFLTLSTDKTTVQTVCFYKYRKQLLEPYFSFETFSDPVEIGHAFCEAYIKKRKFFGRKR